MDEWICSLHGQLLQFSSVHLDGPDALLSPIVMLPTFHTATVQYVNHDACMGLGLTL